MVQEYTTIPVEIITANETTTLAEQIRSFNSFDILITSHGSHLTNGMFLTNPHAKAIIELDFFHPCYSPCPLYFV